MSSDIWTLAEKLAASGYATRFFTAVRTAEIPIRGRFKAAIRRHDAPAVEVLAETKQWWNGTGGPKFGYVQLGDLHEPLREPIALSLA
ncbi:hypothetical protein [Halosimplex halobium]|uniref:hypothetical protein n=1 Tax=Halosimplex halobium TaxID=3396618 RepID=UPI003F544931